jgi:hypothetical protein
LSSTDLFFRSNWSATWETVSMKLSLSVRLTADVGIVMFNSLQKCWFVQCFQSLQESRRSGSVANLRLRSCQTTH